MTSLAIRRYCAARLAPYKVPRRSFFVDAIPLTARGKTDRAALDALVRARLGATERVCYIPRRSPAAATNARDGRRGGGGEEVARMNVWKPVELAPRAPGCVARVSGNQQALRRRSFQPKWAPAPLLKSRERTKPQLGWPRTTDSLCPTCVREARARILSGEQADRSLVDEHVGEIKAHIVERDGKVMIEKTCPLHGTFTDTLAINPAFLERLEIALSRAATSPRSPTGCTTTARRRSSTAAARCSPST